MSAPRRGGVRAPGRDRPRVIDRLAHVPRHWLQTPTARRLQTARGRLAVLAATVVGAALYCGALIVEDPGGTFVGALVLFLVVAALARLAGGPTVSAPPDRLDAHELHRRGRVMGLAQLASTAVLVGLIALVAALGWLLVGREPIEADRVPVLMSAPLLLGLLLHTVVPVAVLAWLERGGPSGRERPRRGKAPVEREAGDRDAGDRERDGGDRGREAGDRDGEPAGRDHGTADATAAIAPDGAGLPITHDFPVVEERPVRAARASSGRARPDTPRPEDRDVR